MIMRLSTRDEAEVLYPTTVGVHDLTSLPLISQLTSNMNIAIYVNLKQSTVKQSGNNEAVNYAKDLLQ